MQLRNFMKTLYLIKRYSFKYLTILIIFFCFNYCRSNKSLATKTNYPSIIKNVAKNYGIDLSGTWQLKGLWGIENLKTGKAFIIINFNDKVFTGNSGCNIIDGKFSLNNNLLVFDKNIKIVKNECSSFNDKNFISMLLKINKFEIHNSILELTQDNIVLMTFKKVN